MLTAIGTWIAKSILLSRLKAGISKIPAKAWLYIAVVILLIVGVIWHQHEVRKELKAANKAGYDRAIADMQKQAPKVTKKLNQISTEIRQRSDNNAQAINSRSDALSLHGPGKARISPDAIAVTTSGYKPTGGTGDAEVARVLDQEWSTLMAVPFDDTRAFAKTCDLNRNEVLSWREYYSKINIYLQSLNKNVDKSSK